MFGGSDPFACFDNVNQQPGDFGRFAFHCATSPVGVDEDAAEKEKKVASSQALDSAFGDFDPFATVVQKRTQKQHVRPRGKSLREIRQEKEAISMDPFTGIPDTFDVAAVDVVAAPAPTTVAADELDDILFGDGFGALLKATAPSSKLEEPVAPTPTTDGKEDEYSAEEEEEEEEEEKEKVLPVIHGEGLHRISSKRIFKKWKDCYVSCSPDAVLSIFPSKDEWVKSEGSKFHQTLKEEIHVHALMVVGDIYEKEDTGSSDCGMVWQMKITENSLQGENAAKIQQLRIWRFDDTRLEAAERLKMGAKEAWGKGMLESIRERLVAKIGSCQQERLTEVSNMDKKKIEASAAARKEHLKRSPRPPKPARDPLAIDQHVY